MAIALVVILIDIFTPRRKIGTLVSVFVGLLAALLATAALSAVIDLIVEAYAITEGAGDLVAAVKVLLGTALAYLGITAAAALTCWLGAQRARRAWRLSRNSGLLSQ